MTTFSGSFTQGGQTQLHKLRMIRQVVAATFKASLWIFLICLVLLVYLDHPWQDFWLLGAYAKAWFMTNCPPAIAQMSPSTMIYNLTGSEGLVSDYFIMHDDTILYWVETIIVSFIKKTFQAILCGIVGSIFISWFWIRQGKNKQTEQILKGQQLVEPKILKKKVFKIGASNYKMGDIPLPKNAEFQHLMVTGTTGSGKSNFIHHLLQQIRENGDQAIIVDTSGGIFSRFYDPSKDILLNPLDARSAAWNIWSECKFLNEYEELAETLITSNSYDKFWTDASRQLFAETCHLFAQNKEDRSLKKLLHILLQAKPAEVYKILASTKVAGFMDPSVEKTALSIRVTMMTALRSLNIIKEEGWFSIKEWIQEPKDQFLFLNCLPDQRELLKPLFSSWLSLAVKSLMSCGENPSRRVWFIIDELASLQKIPILITALTEIRKFGGCIALGFQNLFLLEDIYGTSVSKAISDLTGTKVIFRSVDNDVAKRMSAYLGEQEVVEASESLSYGAHQMRDGVNLSNQKQIRPLVRASEIVNLASLDAYIRFPGDLPVTKCRFDYLSIPLANPAFIQDESKPEESSEFNENSEFYNKQSGQEPELVPTKLVLKEIKQELGNALSAY